MLNIGILGSGRMGKIRIKACKQLGLNISFIYDEKNIEKDPLFNNIKILNEVKDINLDEIDILFVCTPPSSHNDEIVFDAIKKKINIFIEKPFSNSYGNSNKLYKEFKSNNISGYIAFMNLQRKNIKKLISLKNEGRIIGLTSNWICKEYGVDWWKNDKLSGGNIVEQGCHFISLHLFLGGDIEWVFADSNEKKTTYSIMMKHKNNTFSNFIYSSSGEDKYIDFKIMMKDGLIRLNGWDLNVGGVGSYENIENNVESADEIFKNEVVYFLENIHNKSDYTSLENALLTQKIIEAIKNSIMTGKKIYI
ncbi:Gfo/Idh/MocA family protein [Acinetobacter pittii]|uniref:Gfo/Idh/MocA family protein n=1 Tax=Acinetobacter pittii TaxID=48296 RepID=UPI000D397557|nr:Gfo/Idh/MocA family oxidoreductase [Acinetobacter pittii]PTV47359.1 hypothetical protein DBL01_16540 [Acinetobacter pittii]